ncbi:MAG: tRNA (adenosine(37)-N6)-threonylcarbamoyltransferase complex ATPase subunit type 1 TsaE [Planctomycetota bacterium]|jgi:tRNA threonylcarbamoyladenosine biosynthesis protein TsaE
MTVQRRSDGEQETLALAARLAGQLVGGEVICLEGPLGAGKTCFVRGLAAGLGLDASAVCSPSFVICRQYTDGAPLGLVHLDAFRLTGPQDLEAIGWDELLEAADRVVAVEWPSRIEGALPADRIEIVMEHTGEHSRLLTLTAPPELARAWAEATAKGDTACPSCGTAVPADAETFPFCTGRCRLVDLGKWLDGKHRISRPQQDDAAES